MPILYLNDKLNFFLLCCYQHIFTLLLRRYCFIVRGRMPRVYPPTPDRTSAFPEGTHAVVTRTPYISRARKHHGSAFRHPNSSSRTRLSRSPPGSGSGRDTPASAICMASCYRLELWKKKSRGRLKDRQRCPLVTVEDVSTAWRRIVRVGCSIRPDALWLGGWMAAVCMSWAPPNLAKRMTVSWHDVGHVLKWRAG